ncbi:MAG: HD domain-containing protein, partial [Pseudomonadota bacterium]
MLARIFALSLVLLLGSIAHSGTQPMSLSELSLLELYSQSQPQIVPSSPDSVASVDRDLLTSFFSLLPVLREHELSLDDWFREKHVSYLLDFLNSDEKVALTEVFSELRVQVPQLSKSLSEHLALLGKAALVARVSAVEAEMTRLKDIHKAVREYALTKHSVENEQTYGDEPYSYHLMSVREVLKRFGFGPKDSLFGLKLGSAAWLHDVVEDTDSTYEEVAYLFGEEIADIVDGVSKVDRVEGMSDEDRVRATYEKTRANRGSRILKVADRIANVEEGLTDLFAG